MRQTSNQLPKTARKLEEARQLLEDGEAIMALSDVVLVLTEAAKQLSRTAKDLADMQPNEWMTAEQAAKHLGWTAEEVRLASEAMLDATSLDQPIDSEKGTSELGSLVEDEEVSNTADAVAHEMDIEQLRKAIDELPERLRYVLERRYGLEGAEPATLTELGDELNVSSQRVREIQRSAEKALRSGEHAQVLHGVRASN